MHKYVYECGSGRAVCVCMCVRARVCACVHAHLGSDSDTRCNEDRMNANPDAYTKGMEGLLTVGTSV